MHRPPTQDDIPQGPDGFFMQHALRLATQAADRGEVPVGAVVVKDGQIIGTGRNSPIQRSDPTAHAEVLALRDAARTLGNYRLEGCTLYVTLEPCAMCSGAILHSRLDRVVFGAADHKTGCAGSVTNLFAQAGLNHQTQVHAGLLEAESVALLQRFFQHKRAARRASASPLREDALRTPDTCFEGLPGYPWAAHFVSELAELAGLRLHFLDEGSVDAAEVVVCLHPVPGWSYSCRAQIAAWIAEGKRVIAPDLIGFGKSDKPKRPHFHTVETHVRYLLQLMDYLNIGPAKLVCAGTCQVGKQLFGAAAGRFSGLQTLSLATENSDAVWNAPYPDAGHRAGERAFVSGGVC